MTAAEKWDLVSVDDYLAGEEESAVKHEYREGVVYVMGHSIAGGLSGG